MKIRLTILGVAAALLCGTVSAPRAARGGERGGAVVNDEIILETELDQYAAPQYRGADPDTADGKKQWDELKRKALDALIDGKLVQQQAVELKLTVTTDEVERAVQQVKEQNKLDDATFVEALKSQGFSMESYKKTLRKQILEMKVVNTAVRSRVTISDEE